MQVTHSLISFIDFESRNAVRKFKRIRSTRMQQPKTDVDAIGNLVATEEVNHVGLCQLRHQDEGSVRQSADFGDYSLPLPVIFHGQGALLPKLDSGLIFFQLVLGIFKVTCAMDHKFAES